MSDPVHPTTAEFLENWANQAFQNRLAIHFQITDPVLDVRMRAFALMSDALLDAIGMVRVARAALQERDKRLAKWEGNGVCRVEN